jgi:hypothetical protein
MEFKAIIIVIIKAFRVIISREDYYLILPGNLKTMDKQTLDFELSLHFV